MKIIMNSFCIGFLLLNLMFSTLAQPANKKTAPKTRKGSKANKGTKLVQNPGSLRNDDFGVIDSTKYNIDISLEVINLATTGAFARARDRWMNIIIGDLPNVVAPEIDPEYRCHYPEVVDDIHICAVESYIDGEGDGNGFNIIAYAGLSREREDRKNFLAYLFFEQYDAAQLIQKGHWDKFVLLYMGKAIGFERLLYVAGPSNFDECDIDDDFFDDLFDDYLDDDFTNKKETYSSCTKYTGENGLGVWQDDWGCSGPPPIVLDGSYDFYGNTRLFWNGTCLVNELFSYQLNPNDDAKLSKLTIAAFEDMGYKVNYNAADKYDAKDITCCKTDSIAVSSASKLQRSSSQPALSKEGKKYATIHGRNMLRNKKKEMASRRRLLQGNIFTEDENKNNVDAGDAVTVIIEENGYIFDVVVSFDE